MDATPAITPAAAPAAAPEGGDPACHLHLLCPECGAVAAERLSPCCARHAGPVRHPWLGVLRPDREGRLIGGIRIPPAVRPPAPDGDTDCALTIDLGGGGGGEGAVPVSLDDVAARVLRVLEELSALEDFALARAPEHWRRHCEAPDQAPSLKRLFLARLDVVSAEAMDVAFDCGDLGTMLVRVDRSARGREVRLLG